MLSVLRPFCSGQEKSYCQYVCDRIFPTLSNFSHAGRIFPMLSDFFPRRPDLSHAIRFFPHCQIFSHAGRIFPALSDFSHAGRIFPMLSDFFPRYHIFSHAVRFFPTLVTIFPTLSDCSLMVIYRSLAFHTQMFCGWREKTHGKCCKTPINSLMKVNNRMVSSFVTVFRHFFRFFFIKFECMPHC